MATDESVIYFGKLNLSSNEIHDIYKDQGKLQSILSELMDIINTGIMYVEQHPIPLTQKEKAEGREIKFEKVEYRLDVQQKTVSGIEGYVFKTSNLYYNRLTQKNTLKSSAVENTEAIHFYLDVYNEYIGYNTKDRFGHQMFLTAFENIINKSLEDENKSYKFELSLYTDGIDLSDIKRELRAIKDIGKLEIKIKPPNPDTIDIDEIENNLEEKLEELKEACASMQTITLEATGISPLNTDSKLVIKNLNAIESIHSSISSKKATSKGYAQVKATTKSGVTYVSGENKPKTTKTNKESFVDTITSFIAKILIQ